jgi:hypothetical protein
MLLLHSAGSGYVWKVKATEGVALTSSSQQAVQEHFDSGKRRTASKPLLVQQQWRRSTVMYSGRYECILLNIQCIQNCVK